MIWKIYNNTLLIGQFSRDKKFYKKSAAFDLDDTLIVTRSGKKFAQDENDWKFYNENVLKKLSREDSIIIFSNQKKLDEKPKKFNEFKDKINAIIKEIPCKSITIIAALRNDHYRKPGIGMYEYVSKTTEIKCYVGDAYGEGAFSDSDLKFADNLNIPFYKPQDFFNDNTVRLQN